MNKSLFPTIEERIKKAANLSISEKRIKVLAPLISYITEMQIVKKPIQLNFICTHNSRRSQFAQVWGQTIADYLGLPIFCYSGGVEITACNIRTLKSLGRAGFQVHTPSEENPKNEIKYADDQPPIILFSKLFDDPVNPKENFAAVMTCSDADENCPFIPGTEKRIALNYEDPKAFDNTEKEEEMYDERSMQIASELFYVFKTVKEKNEKA